LKLYRGENGIDSILLNARKWPKSGPDWAAYSLGWFLSSRAALIGLIRSLGRKPETHDLLVM
jgi:hypothetical protein